MRKKIFLSHAHEDKDIVSNIAEELRKTFGEENIFYDSWSMKPGESFIDGMNKGLEECLYFFLFMSETSLKKPMVRLEWHNALVASLLDNSHFIPVRVDDIKPPAILLTKLYLDMYNRGLPQTIEDIKMLLAGKGIYDPASMEPFSNLFVKFEKTTDGLVILINAKKLVEHSNNFAFWTSDGKKPSANGLLFTNSGNVKYDNEEIPVKTIKQQWAITPNTPATFVISNPSSKFRIRIFQIIGEGANLLNDSEIDMSAF